MNYSTILAFCIAQLLVIIGVLTLKRFRNYVNLFLGAILVVIFLKFIYYYFHFKGLFLDYPLLIYFIRVLQLLPPSLLWFYSSAIITGSIILRKRMFLHMIPVAVSLVFFMPLFVNTVNPDIIPFSLLIYNKWFGLIFSELAGILFIIYSQFIFRELYKIYGANKNLKDCLLDFTHQHLTLLKVLSVMMNVYALILIGGGFIAFFSETSTTLFDYLDAGFLIVLSYIMMFILVSIPKVIHFKYSSLLNSDKLLKYEKSSLTRKEANEYMQDMNKWMEAEKPYLNSNLSLGDFTEEMHLPGHIISEVLNGLLKQNFYDYINNYRIEEFKRLVVLQANINETNLNLAFDAGFNSRTTFNTSFKKFTNQTPSEFRKLIN